MLVIFRAGPKGDQTLDLIDVIPREKEKTIWDRGLGKKAGRFFWVQVDDSKLSDTKFNELAAELVSPQLDGAIPINRAYIKSTPDPKPRIVAKRKYRLNQNALEQLDPAFDASASYRTLDASSIFPQKILTLQQFAKIIRNKATGRDLNGD